MSVFRWTSSGIFDGRPAVVLFDLDGTLVDTAGAIRRSLQACHEQIFQRPLSEVGLEQSLGQALVSTLSSWGLSGERLARGQAVYLEHHAEELQRCQAFAGVEPLLMALRQRGVRCAVVTNKGSAAAALALRASGLAPYIEALVGADAVETPKPDPAMLYLALERLACCNQPAAAVVVVGDRSQDMEAARRGGYRAGLAMWSAAAPEPAAIRLADVCLHKPESLLA